MAKVDTFLVIYALRVNISLQLKQMTARCNPLESVKEYTRIEPLSLSEHEYST